MGMWKLEKIWTVFSYGKNDSKKDRQGMNGRITYTLVSTVQRGESLEDFKAGKPYDWICILERRLCSL